MRGGDGLKLPFTWAELSPEDKAWLENVPATAVWDFVDTLPKLERLPFDDPYNAPSGADFMSKYGDRLRAFVNEHENDPLEIDPELDTALNAIDPKLAEGFYGELKRIQQKFEAGELGLEELFAEQKSAAQKWSSDPSTAKVQVYDQKKRDAADAYYKHFAPNGRIDTGEVLLAAKYRALIAQLLEAARNYRTHQQADQKKITELKAEVAKLTAERDAALKARDEMLKLYTDQLGK